MQKFFKLSFAAALFLGFAALLNSCKKDFDQPPSPGDPNIVANRTIAALKAMHTVSGAYDVITDDIIISGVVVANDKSGNLYKQLFIQDSTGAIQLLLDANSLYGSYPVGRRIFVKAKGLCLSDYNRTMMLGIKATVGGLPSVEGIPGGLISNYVIGGSINNPVNPLVVTQAQLGTSMHDRYVGALIQLDDYEFEASDTSKTYSDTSAFKSTQNRYIKPCSGPSLTVRTSAYANFAGIKLPSGHGSIVAIYTLFGSTKQLLLRDTSDVHFDAPRGCPLPPGTLLFQNFEDQVVPGAAPYNAISVAGWNNLSEIGGRTWTARLFSNNKHAELSAFGSNVSVLKTWLVTSGVNLNNTATENLSFETNQGYIGAGGITASQLKILVSTNYTGTGNPWAAGVIWTDITAQAVLSPGAASGFPSNFTNSGNISLSAYTGTIYVAFRYEGADPTGTSGDKTSTWEVDNVKIIGN